MGDTMLLGVLRMPINDDNPVHLSQLKARARQAADRIEADAKEIERLRAAATRYLAHSDSGTYRDSAGLRPGTSLAGEDLRAALAGKEDV